MIALCPLHLLIPALLAASASQPSDGNRPGSDANRVKLVFSMDQGFGNGPVINRDLEGVRRMCRAVKTLEPQYETYFVLNPQIGDKGSFEVVLDMLASEDVPFVLDVYSSDSQTLGTTTGHNAPADGPHGISASLDDLDRCKRKYKRHFAGLRFMELFAMDFTNRAVKTTNPEWNTAGWRLPDDPFFQPELARSFLRFARENRMFVQWSDWHWSRFHPWDAPLTGQERALHALIHEFPSTVILTYANNEPAEASAPRLTGWEDAVKPFVADGAAAIGLSNQAWLREPEMSCPVEEIVAWTRQARRVGCRYIQFEPAWYFFKLPRGTFGRELYVGKPGWEDCGSPLAAFNRLRAALEAGD